MNSLLVAIAILVLGGVLSLESSVLMACMDEIASLRKRLDGAAAVDVTHRLVSRQLPTFRAELFEPSMTLRSEDLRGDSSMLLFIDPESVFAMTPATFPTVLHLLLHRIDGYLYVVCGNRAQCRRLKSMGVLPDSYWARTRLVLDPRNDLREKLGVSSSWTAVLIDAAGRVARVGHGAFNHATRNTTDGQS